MKISFDKLNLAPAIDLVQQTVNDKSPLPIYSYLLIDATEEGDIYLCSNDGALGLVAKVVGDIEEPGSYAVPAKRIFAVLQTLAVDKKIEITGQPGNRILITSDRGKYRIACLPSDDFPETIRHTSKENEIPIMSLNGEQFRSAIDQTIFAAAVKTDRNLDSLCFNFSKDKFEVVGADGILLSRIICNVKETDTIDERNFLMPIESAKHARRVFNSAYDLTLWQNKSSIIISDETNTLSTRLFDGIYPPYETILAPNPVHIAEFERMALIALLKRVSVLASLQKGCLVSMSIQPQQNGTSAVITASAQVEDEGEAEDMIDIASASAPLNINFNCNLLLKVLTGMKSKIVKMLYADSTQLVKLQSTETEIYGNQTCLISPMRDRTKQEFVEEVEEVEKVEEVGEVEE